MGPLTIYTYLDQDNVPYVEIYDGDTMLEVLEAGSGWSELSSGGGRNDVRVVHVDWNEVQAWDAGNIEDVEALVSALRRLPTKRMHDELESVQQWLEANEPEDYDGAEQTWQDVRERVSDLLAIAE